MRRLLPLALALLAGCAKGPTSEVGTLSPAGSGEDAVAAQREKDAQAAYGLDAAGASLKEAYDGAKRLAATAGGTAKDGLLDVADMLDSAGATLAEHDDPPPALEEYRKAEATQKTARDKALADALDALHELRDAEGTLDDLAQNAPKDHAAALDAIQTSADDAESSISDAITTLGGKVPPEDEGEDQPSNDGS